MGKLNDIYMDVITQMNTKGISDAFQQPIMPRSGLRLSNGAIYRSNYDYLVRYVQFNGNDCALIYDSTGSACLWTVERLIHFIDRNDMQRISETDSKILNRILDRVLPAITEQQQEYRKTGKRPEFKLETIIAWGDTPDIDILHEWKRKAERNQETHEVLRILAVFPA